MRANESTQKYRLNLKGMTFWKYVWVCSIYLYGMDDTVGSSLATATNTQIQGFIDFKF